MVKIPKKRKEKSVTSLVNKISSDKGSWRPETYEPKPGKPYYRLRNNKTKEILYIGNKLRFDTVMAKLEEKQ